MLHRRFAIRPWLLLIALALAGGWMSGGAARAQGPSAEEVRAIEDLQRKMDDAKLARDNVKLGAMVESVAKRTAELRELPLLAPIRQNTLTREKTKEVIRHALERELPDSKAKAVSRALWLLGAVPKRDLDLRELYIGLLGEQVAGLYDDETGQLYVSAVFGADSNLARVILAHEITHALQDQHFDLKRSPIHDKNNDDRAIAALSVIEGDATLVMMEYLFEHLSLSWLKDLPRAMQLDQKQLNAAPPYFQYLLVFPYIEGMQLLLYAEGGGHRFARNLLLKNPPRSTEQVLHPERLFALPADEPTTVTIDVGACEVRGLRPGMYRAYENTVGEAGMRAVLLDPARPLNFSMTSTRPLDVPPAIAAATNGWGGDRAAIYLSNSDPGASWLVWKTEWDSEADAREFREFLETVWLPRRFERQHTAAATAGAAPAGSGSGSNWMQAGTADAKQALRAQLAQQDKTVWIMIGEGETHTDGERWRACP